MKHMKMKHGTAKRSQQHTDETADEYCRQVCANVLFTVNCSEICGRAYTEMLFTV